MNKKELQAAYNAKSDMIEHYKELFTTSINQVQFLNMQILSLKNLLREVDTVSDDSLVSRIINNGLERREIEKLRQTRTIFGKNPEGLK